jgi:hypothetical protein
MNVTELNTDATISHIDALELKQGLSSEEVHKRAIASRNLYGKAQKALIFWIAEMDERKLYKDFGCSNIFQYATRYLNLGEHAIAEMLRTGKALAQLPLLSEALEKGQISSSHVREISRVVTEETEQFWCDAARGKTVREVEKLVAFTPQGGLPAMKCTVPQPSRSTTSAFLQASPPAPDDALTYTRPIETPQKESFTSEMPIQHQNSLKYHEKLVIDLDAEEMSVLKDAFAKAQKESGLRGRASLLLHIAKAFLEGCTSSRARRKPRYQIVLHRHLPSGLTWCNTPKGERPVSPEVLQNALSDAEIVELDEPGGPTWDQNDEKETCPSVMKDDAGDESNGRQNEALDHVNEQYMKIKAAKREGRRPCKDFNSEFRKERRSIPEAMRKKILLRDGYTCQAPGCGSKIFLSIHHLIPFAISGIHCIGSLMVLCSGCHALVHEGKLSVEGEAPNRLIWRDGKGRVI